MRNTSLMLLLKRHLVELVRSGKKRQTIRLWTRAMVKPGQISYTPGLGRMKITSVESLPTLSALTQADAVADGFNSLAELLAEIQSIYGDHPVGRTIFRIRFDWPIDEAGEKLVIAQAREGRKEPVRRGRKAAGATPRMSAIQRRELRSFILSQSPPRVTGGASLDRGVLERGARLRARDRVLSRKQNHQN